MHHFCVHPVPELFLDSGLSLCSTAPENSVASGVTWSRIWQAAFVLFCFLWSCGAVCRLGAAFFFPAKASIWLGAFAAGGERRGLLGDALRQEAQRGEGSGVKCGSFFTKRGQGTGLRIQQKN